MRMFLKSTWWLIVNAGYLLLILVISFIAFTVPEQTQDFILVFLQDFEIDYIIAVYISLPLWCFITWYSACIVLQIDPVKASLDQKDNEKHIELSLIIPKIMGIVPCLIFAYAIAFTDNLEGNNSLLHIGIIAVIMILMLLLFVGIDKYSNVKNNISSKSDDRNMDSYDYPKGFWPFVKYLYRVKPLGNWPSLKEVDIFKNKTKQDPTFSQELIFIAQFTGVRFYYKWLGTFCLILTLAWCFPSVNLALSTWLRPGAILILSITCYTLLFTVIAYFHDYARRPFGIIVLIIVILFSYWNDNTQPVYLENKKVSKRLAADLVFDRWIQIKKKDWSQHHPGKDMPIVFIATQGGGIRGMAWTTRTFHYLDSVYEGFIDQTFLISGVSGGGVGATTFLSWLHDQKHKNDSLSTYAQFNQFTKRDFLSPVTASFAFGDNLQRFLPFSVSSLDRSKILGRTMDQYYDECLGRNSFSKSFLEMWYPGKGFNYTIPSLILNGTLAENGQRVITSNLKVSSSQYFEDDIDFFSFTEKDISRSTAALNCSRFPFITSGALLAHGSDRKGHIVDGGYRENTGLQTLVNMFCSLRKRLKNETGIKVFVIYLQNGNDELNNQVSASSVMQDLLVPLQGLIHVNGTGMPAKSIVQYTNQIFDNNNACENVMFFRLSLEDRENSKIKLPLGWYMSDIVSKEIDQRVTDIATIDSALSETLAKWFPDK